MAATLAASVRSLIASHTTPRFERFPPLPLTAPDPPSHLYVIPSATKVPKFLQRHEVLESTPPTRVGMLVIRRYSVLGSRWGFEIYSISEPSSGAFRSESLCRAVLLDTPSVRLHLADSCEFMESVAEAFQRNGPLQICDTPASSKESVSPQGISPTESEPTWSDDPLHPSTPLTKGLRALRFGLPLLEMFHSMMQRHLLYKVDVAASWAAAASVGSFSLEHRDRVVNTCDETVQYFGGSPTTAHYAISYAEAALAARPDFARSPGSLRSLLSTSALLAVKNFEVQLPARETICRTFVDLSSAAIREQEVQLLSVLRFRLHPTLAIELVGVLNELLGVGSVNHERTQWCHLLADIVVRKSQFLRFSPAVLAVAICRLTQTLFASPSEPSVMELLTALHLHELEVQPAVELLQLIHDNEIRTKDLPVVLLSRYANALKGRS